MKVIEFINRLNQIGYDEGTELVFGAYDSTEFHDWHELENPIITRGFDFLESGGMGGSVISVNMDIEV
jgi:hypothetical protein